MKSGDIVFHKSSEDVMVVLTRVSPEETEVRRCSPSQNGTQYEAQVFFNFELETGEERDKRILTDIIRRHKMSTAAQKEADIQAAAEFPLATPFTN